ELVRQIFIDRIRVAGKRETVSEIRRTQKERAQIGDVGGRSCLLYAPQGGRGPLAADIGKEVAHAPAAKDRATEGIIEVHYLRDRRNVIGIVDREDVPAVAAIAAGESAGIILPVVTIRSDTLGATLQAAQRIGSLEH